MKSDDEEYSIGTKLMYYVDQAETDISINSYLEKLTILYPFLPFYNVKSLLDPLHRHFIKFTLVWAFVQSCKTEILVQIQNLPTVLNMSG